MSLGKTSKLYVRYSPFWLISLLLTPILCIPGTLLYTATGRAFDWPWKSYPVSTEDREQIVQFIKQLPPLVTNGEIKPLPIKLWEGGLEAIPDGLQYLRDGKASAQKVVYRL